MILKKWKETSDFSKFIFSRQYMLNNLNVIQYGSGINLFKFLFKLSIVYQHCTFKKHDNSQENKCLCNQK